ncbi:MAG TPA: DUF1638 domain-containing protein [Candidatus Limnocylindrales bacterium]|nr:DUF1638 domain-containing protein [Candidatus Limnocylindrales bacterium]
MTDGIPGLDVACLAPDLHNRPDGIPAAVRRRIHEARSNGYERIFVAYADCGTGGLLDPVLADEGVERLPGAHCYEVFAGSADFARMAEAEPGTFWLTDFLARNFERLVIRGLGIDRHPELDAVYFAHYARVVYLSQTDDPELLAAARRAAARLGLAFEHRRTGIGHLAQPIRAFAAAGPADGRTVSSADHPASENDERRADRATAAHPASRTRRTGPGSIDRPRPRPASTIHSPTAPDVAFARGTSTEAAVAVGGGNER